MTDTLRYDPSAARKWLSPYAWDAAVPLLEAARAEVRADIELYNSKKPIPQFKQPLDAGFIEWPKRLLDEHAAKGAASQLGQIIACGQRLRESFDRVVFLGIGGSYMGAKALFEGLCHPIHNELSREARNGIPRVYFEGNNVDNDALGALMATFPKAGGAKSVTDKFATVCISKSGGTLETAVAFRIFRKAAEDYYGAGSADLKNAIVAVTGETGKLRNVTNEQQYASHFPIPDGIGGRCSILTAVGLLPAAVLGIDVVALLKGAADMTDSFLTAPLGSNPALDYTGISHLFETTGLKIRVLSTWGKKLESVGLWYDQLLSESLGKDGRGATPITCVNTRDLHSRGQQHQEGTRDKIITNLIVENASAPALGVPSFGTDLDDLNQYSKKTIPDVLRAAILGTNQAYADEGRPTTDIVLPRLSAYSLGQVFQMLMLATAVEGRLLGINPYGQPGVEAYKKNMVRLLKG